MPSYACAMDLLERERHVEALDHWLREAEAGQGRLVLIAADAVLCLEPIRSFLIVTYRDDEVGAKHPLRLALGDLATTKTVRRLSLAPLSQDGVRTLAAGSRLDPVSLYRLTGGNPFFTTEVLAA